MYSTQNNIIVMTRGDSLEFKPTPITLRDFATYQLQGDDTIYFGLMDPGQPFEAALVRKVFTADDFSSLEDFVIEFTPEDTLDLLPGKYFYALKLHINHIEIKPIDAYNYESVELDKVVTLINKTKFIIND
jgi:hypothetical protein